MSGMVYYFCGLSGKWHLDWCRMLEYNAETGNVARVARKWQAKVKIMCKIVLGDNEKTFRTENECWQYALKQYGRTAIPYVPLWDSGKTKWVEVKK